MNAPRDRYPPNRREMRSSIGSLVALGTLGCGGSPPTSSSSSASTGSTNSSCTVTPALTEGPYFVDERLNRSDIRSDPASGVGRAGVPLSLIIRLTQVTAAGACVALPGALVDLWHCDALGVYSDIGSATGKEGLKA